LTKCRALCGRCWGREHRPARFWTEIPSRQSRTNLQHTFSSIRLITFCTKRVTFERISSKICRSFENSIKMCSHIVNQKRNFTISSRAHVWIAPLYSNAQMQE
jgi:hypothetical protein